MKPKIPRDLRKTIRTLQKLDKQVLALCDRLEKLEQAYYPFEWQLRPHTLLACQVLHGELMANMQELQNLPFGK